MLKKEIECAVKNGKQLFWLGETRLLFEPIVELNHWSRNQWFATVIDDNGELIRETIRSGDICNWSAGSADGIELARMKLAAYDARKAANAKPLELQPVDSVEKLRQELSQMSQKHDQYLKENELCNLTFPICCESQDLEGNWILVTLLRWLGNGKWLAHDEDGERIIVDASHLRNPHL